MTERARMYTYTESPQFIHDCDRCKFKYGIKVETAHGGGQEDKTLLQADVYENCSPDKGISDLIVRYSSEGHDYMTTTEQRLVVHGLEYYKGIPFCAMPFNKLSTLLSKIIIELGQLEAGIVDLDQDGFEALDNLKTMLKKVSNDITT